MRDGTNAAQIADSCDGSDQFLHFEQEFGETHRDYLFDLYSTWVSRTRSNSEEEFGVLVFQVFAQPIYSRFYLKSTVCLTPAPAEQTQLRTKQA